MIPADGFFHVKNGKDAEDDQGDDFLNGFELDHGKIIMADPVSRHLKAVLHERDEPAHHDGDPQGRAFVLQVAVPREGHENIG